VQPLRSPARQPWKAVVTSTTGSTTPRTAGEQLAESGQGQSQNEKEEDTVAAPRILVVEDYPNNQLVILAHLRKLGLQADVMENGRAAVDALLAHHDRYHLIFMDWQMPVMDGLEATRLIRKIERNRGEHIPIIGMTANAIKGDREHCLAAGMDDYLTKPLNMAELHRVLTQWLPTEQTAPVMQRI
jgi:CheY-like chemotaxis protein